MAISPEFILSEDDKGDDVQRRFLYQSSYAAILSLGLINEDSEFEELFCEHHEDILLKKNNGQFSGIQVKTQQLGLELFKSRDKAIVNSILKFCKLEESFPDYFDNYVIVTNSSFWNVTKNGSNLQFILDEVRKYFLNRSGEKSKFVISYEKYILKNYKTKYQKELLDQKIFDVLNKLKLDDSLPKFNDIENRIIRMIPENFDCEDAGLEDLLGATKDLVSATYSASALINNNQCEMFYPYFEKPDDEKIANIISGKKISRNDVETILLNNLSPRVLLKTRGKIEINNLPKNISRIDLKMGMGGVSAKNIKLMKDHYFSSYYLLLGWVNKYGGKRSKEQFEQLQLIIHNECQEIYDLKFSKENNFGQEMLIEARIMIRRRIEIDKHLFFNCEYEHLLGVVGILTEMCVLWWSEEFEIPGEKENEFI